MSVPLLLDNISTVIVRLVKLTLQPDKIDDFMQLFHEVRNTIAAFDGCHRVELLQDTERPFVFFTYSIWENEHYLNQYRFSEFFKQTWARTKPLFAQKAEAWSVHLVDRATATGF
ncbi:MAG: antibiotic biosynthesis monooxygenase [Chitinophagales bacterium]|nr:antibiotic biosynthesis monooxygenase [Chitinophagales bacterium]MDW8427036.1 antibiotic biosynthesis monooxygenase [Chitinophagales bacterium]